MTAKSAARDSLKKNTTDLERHPRIHTKNTAKSPPGGKTVQEPRTKQNREDGYETIVCGLRYQTQDISEEEQQHKECEWSAATTQMETPKKIEVVDINHIIRNTAARQSQTPGLVILYLNYKN